MLCFPGSKQLSQAPIRPSRQPALDLTDVCCAARTHLCRAGELLLGTQHVPHSPTGLDPEHLDPECLIPRVTCEAEVPLQARLPSQQGSTHLICLVNSISRKIHAALWDPDPDPDPGWGCGTVAEYVRGLDLRGPKQGRVPHLCCSLARTCAGPLGFLPSSSLILFFSHDSASEPSPHHGSLLGGGCVVLEKEGVGRATSHTSRDTSHMPLTPRSLDPRGIGFPSILPPYHQESLRLLRPWRAGSMSWLIVGTQPHLACLAATAFLRSPAELGL